MITLEGGDPHQDPNFQGVRPSKWYLGHLQGLR